MGSVSAIEGALVVICFVVERDKKEGRGRRVRRVHTFGSLAVEAKVTGGLQLTREGLACFLHSVSQSDISARTCSLYLAWVVSHDY